MKTRTLILLILGSVVLISLVGLALVLTPAVQTWAVRKALADQSGADATVGRVAAGWSGAEVSGLRWADADMSLHVDRAVVRYSAFGLIFSGRVALDEVVVDGFELDLRRSRQATAPVPTEDGSRAPAPRSPSTRPGPATEDAPGQPFAGVLEKLTLPEGFRLGTVVVDGRVLLPEAQTATIALRGGNVVAGAEGKLSWTLSFVDETPEAALRAVRADGEGTVRISVEGRAERLAGNLTVAFEGDDLPADRLRADFLVEPEAAGRERYEARVARVTGSATEPLVSIDGAFAAAAARVDGTWRLTLAGPSLAALLAGLNLPELDVSGEGTFAVQTDSGAFTTTGTADGRMAGMGVLSPALASVDAIRFNTTFEARGDDAQVSLARFELEVATPEGVSLAAVRTLQPVAFVLADQRLVFANADADLARVALESIPLAWAQPFVDGLTIERGEVSLDVAVGGSADGARVSVRSDRPLSIRNLNVSGPDGPLVSEATLTAYPKIDYEAGLLRAELAEVDLALAAGDRVEGTLTAEVSELFSQPSTVFSARLEGRLVALQAPYVPVETGPLGFSASVEGRHAGRVLELDATNVALRREADVPLATVELRAPFALDLDSFAFTQAPGLAVGVELGRVPLEWIEAFVQGLELSGEVTGGALEVIMASPTQLTANTLSPLTVQDAGGAWQEKPLARNLDATIDFRAELRDEVVTYDVRRLEVAQEGGQLVSTKAAGTVDLGAENLRFAVRGELGADAASLRQVVPASYATLAGGRILAVFEATQADVLQANAVITARNLVAREENKALGDVDLSLTLGVRPDGTGTVNVPLKLTVGGRASDLALEGTYTKSEKGLTIAGKVSGERVTIDDLQAFTALAPSSPPAVPQTRPAQAPPARSPGRSDETGRDGTTRDAKPFWSGVDGRLEADIRNATYGPETNLKEVRGVFVIAESRLALETFEGRMNENPFKLNGVVTFDAEKAKPYGLSGSAQVTQLDLGAVLAAANPREKPAIETKVSADGRLTGTGANLEELLQRVQGTFDVKGSSGVLRALGRRGEAVGAVSAIVGIIGAARGSATTMATAELASQLNELRFDSVTFKVERGADLDVKLTALEFVSPTSRVTGTGTISHRDDVPLTKQPLRLQLSLAGKGALAQVLNRLGLLDGNQDDREYYTVSRLFTISGTPLVPDSGDLWRFVGEAAVRAAMAPRRQESQDANTEGTSTAPQGQGTTPR